MPKADVKATLKDFKVELPKTVKAGKQLWEISNAGQETHHLMLMRLNDGKTMKDVEAFFKAPDPSQAGAPPSKMWADSKPSPRDARPLRAST
ncbi:hypothetical protein ACFSC4_27065 [Deinococcus malanensis]|uniref:hypothetical protein n=1 Tax=Deinococcus malanensis TaxID=1706855 RepID=UPI0036281818